MGGHGKAEPSTVASALKVRERGAQATTQPWSFRRWKVAERAGFEPAVLSHTAFRERHHQPLGHLSAGEDTKPVVTGRSGESGAVDQRAGSGSNRARASSRRMPLTTLIRRGSPGC